MQTVYFDYNATTPLDPQVREAMLPFLGEVWGNPSSVHQVGRQARAHLDDARDRREGFEEGGRDGADGRERGTHREPGPPDRGVKGV